MKFDELKPKMKVFDTWYPENGPGFILKKTKSTTTVWFANMIVWTYDKGHVQFLERTK
jgi:hypothetical protein